MPSLEIEDAGPIGAGPALAADMDSAGNLSAARSTAPAAPKAVPAIEMGTGHAAPTSLSDAARDRLAALRSGPPAKAERPAEATPPPAPAPAVATPPPTSDEADDGEVVPVAGDAAATPPAATEAAPAPEWEAERAELTGIRDRQRGIIEQLRTEVETLKKSSAVENEARAKRIAEAEESYVRDPIGAIRGFISSALGLDPTSKEAEQELSDVFIDLTSTLSGVNADAAHQAKRQSALIRRELDQSNKRRSAGENKTAQSESAPADPVEAALPIVKEKFASLAAKFPHLAAAADLDGVEPERVLADLIMRGYQSGDFDPNEPNDLVTIEKAARLAENHYKPRLEKIWARKPGTATPGVPAATAQKDPPAAPAGQNTARQGTGRALGNADASVAPNKTPPPVKDEKPPLKSDAERRAWATRHLRK